MLSDSCGHSRRRRYGGARKPDVGPYGYRRRSGAGRRSHHPVDRGHNRRCGATTPRHANVRQRLPVGHVSDTDDRGYGVWSETPIKNGA